MWAIAGLVYAAAYVAGVLALGDHAHARLLIGNAALLLPPIAPLVVILRRRDHWRGRQAVFWSAIAAWPALWLIGQIGWASDEILRSLPLPWFKWHIILQLSGSALPFVALVAWPHRGVRDDTAKTAAIDIAVLGFLTGFLYWSLIIAPGMDPSHAAEGLRTLAIVGPIVRLVAVVGLVAAAIAADSRAWSAVYQRLAFGMILAFVVLIVLSMMTVRGAYQTGSPADIGWMLPFWFTAWAAATAPSSPAESRSIAMWQTRRQSPALLFAAVLAVPIIGFGLRYVMPIGEPIDRLREMAASLTLVCAVALVMIRLRVEQFELDRANNRVRLLATACEQAGELVIIVRGSTIEYANDAFCRAVGYSLQELEHIQPMQMVAEESLAELPPLRESIRRRQVVRATTVMLRKDGTKFNAAWTAAPIVDAAGRVSTIVGVIRDMTDELKLRDQLVKSERLSAIGQLISGVAHELNNPLQSIIGSLELLLNEPTDPDMQDDVERARREAGRAVRIVRNLLAFVRRAPDERLLMDVNEIVRSVTGVRAYELEIAGIAVREQYAPDLPLVLVNREEMQQVFANLIINAQQAMGARGRGVLSIRTFVSGPDACIDIRDDGPGMPAEVTGRLFEPFVSTKSSTGGLGLSLSFGIANAHGGSLELVPSDVGAWFRVTLPGAGYPGRLQNPHGDDAVSSPLR
ncbi:MAG TPA: ATP-binding protein [Vicinamibacterales bacterium]|nr:ATP-binding protein [Vicinamibacterales bacterium]